MKILVAGAGHGGLVAAGLLAKQGHGVTVFERNPEKDLGHDWTDIFSLKNCFNEVGIPLPEPHEYECANEMTFINPSTSAPITARTPPERSTESKMERRAILRHLIKFARDNGAQFVFEAAVERPLTEGKRVTGLVVAGKEIRGDLVVDSAGMHSPVRTQLPAEFGIVKEFGRMQYFTVYRAFHNDTGAPASENYFNVYFLPLGRTGVAWAANEKGYVDFVCGSFTNTDRAYAEEIRQYFIPRHPNLGDEILRGGYAVDIPVRRPIGLMVADGYAAVGDCAAMTVPLNGNGMTNAIRAGRVLAETVAAAKDATAAALWPYQVQYMRNWGATAASLDVFKTFMMTVKPEVVDFLFDKHLLSPQDMENARVGNAITFTLPDLVSRGVRGAAQLPSMIKLAGAFGGSQKLMKFAKKIPDKYDEAAVKAWATKYEAM